MTGSPVCSFDPSDCAAAHFPGRRPFLFKSRDECAILRILTRSFKEFGCVDIMECVRCGATAVVEGSLMDTGGGGGLAFLFKDISKLKSIFGAGSRKINAHACLHCSHIELTVEFTEKDRKRYQEFDGPQPALDRIN